MLANVVDMRFLGLMVSFILLVCVAGVLAQPVTRAGNDVVPKDLKKLFDPIEELRQDMALRKLRQNMPDKDFDSFPISKRAAKSLSDVVRKLDNFPCTDEFCGNLFVKPASGSFTQTAAVQQIQYVGGGGHMPDNFVLFESDKVRSVYSSGSVFSFYSVRDINQNGISELLVRIQSSAKPPYDKMSAIQLLEFRNKKPTTLGNFFVGGAPVTSADGGADFDDICSPKAGKEFRTHFPANIIYVRKGKIPKYFAEPYNINCDFQEKGIIATKLSPITPIKPVMRPVVLKRIY